MPTLPQSRTRKRMRIGELAKRTGLTVETLRFYERAGVLGDVTRDASGYRVYDQQAYRNLLSLRWAQEAGLRLEEIAGILNQNGHASPRDRVALLRRLVDQRVTALHAQIAEKRKLIERLETLRATPFDGQCVIPGAFVDELVAAHEQRRGSDTASGADSASPPRSRGQQPATVARRARRSRRA